MRKNKAIRKLNCWEFLKCGREPGGSRVLELGECPAAIEKSFDGINNGKNGGRICWFICGTLCQAEVQGKYDSKLSECLDCKFYQLVSKEEGYNFKRSVNFFPPSFIEKINPEKIKRRILIPITLIILLFFTASIFAAYRFQQWHINKSLNDKINGIEKLFAILLKDEAKLVGGRLESLKNNKNLQRAWMTKDRDILYRYSAQLFQKMSSEDNITRFFFIENNLNCFLRVDNPDYSGHIRKNIITETAVREEKPAWGLSVSRFGALTLRVVHPWLINGRLSGYMELGKEIADLQSKLKSTFNTELIFIIEKRFAHGIGPEQGLKATGLNMPHDYIIIDHTLSDIPAGFIKFFMKLQKFEKNRIHNIDIDERRFRIGFINLNETDKRNIGKMAIISDVTKEEQSLQKFLLSLIAVSAVAGGLLFLFFFFYLHRVELRMKDSHDNLKEIILQRNLVEETLRESEDKFRLLSEQSLVGIVILQDNVFKYANQAMADILEYTIEELLTLPVNGFMEIIYPDDRPLVMEQARKKQRGDKDIILNYTWRVITKSGRIKWVETYSKSITFKGKTANFVNMIDITKRKKAEDDQRSLELQLIQSQKMESVGRLAGGIAHDFNNLLSIIIGYSDLSIMQLSDNTAEINELKKTLTSIKEAGEKASALTRQLLAFSRKQVMEMKPVNLNSIVDNMANMLKRIIREDISLALNTKNPVKNILADIGQIEQIIMNLTINARDAIKNGGHITIEISGIEADEESHKICSGIAPGSYVILRVADTGEGMSDEIKERIFEPFFTTKAQGEGTGLGLSMVYGIVKQHNAYIHVDTESGKGTKFSIFFPAANDKYEIPKKKEYNRMPEGFETILVAEDEKNIRDLVKDILEPLGYKLLIAENGREALEVSNKYDKNIDALLTDVVMPVMNGYELAERMKKARPGIKTIFMSGYIGDPVIHQYIIDSNANFISKPISPTRLANVIREVLDSS